MNKNLVSIRPQLLTNIQNIALKDIITPTIPIAIYLQEIENIAVWATDDLTALNKVGITANHIKDLKDRINACRSFQTEWLKLKNIKPTKQKECEELRHVASKQRDELVFIYRYAFRNNIAALKEIKAINKKNTTAELVATLANLIRIGRTYPELLEKISFDFTQLDKGKELGYKLQGQHSDFVTTTPEKDKIKYLRDKSYTHLKHLADDIKNAGKFVFAKNKERLKGYEIAYYKKKKAYLKENVNSQ
ncbi:hypothetical protein BZG02_19090 [Labilibaculum filiforme]|uniref:Uncharacterized protein n=1 Tax=Labilibaculum filiforme TaxID=1940526 RepID=A0A2N3HQY5_9BACT|nr:hypothetical protein [Labilibaculum filiforme]PKQ60463.1 hypothetical protein BZG02_19090 [Labilibaculum filiforme]